MNQSFANILIAQKLVSAEQLKQAQSYADSIGIDLHEAVLQRRIAPPEAVMLAYAEAAAMPFVHLDDVAVDESVTVQISPNTARHYSFIPFAVQGGFVHVLCGKPISLDAEESVKAVFNLPVKCFICLPSELNVAISKIFPRDVVKSGGTGRRSGGAASSSPRVAVAERVPLTDEESRNRLLYTIMTFNFSVFGICFSLYNLQIPRAFHNTAYQFPVLALFGIIGGGLAAAMVWKKLSR